MARRAYIGIDPGVSGAIAILRYDGSLLSVHDMPTMKLGKANRVNAAELARLISPAQEFQCSAVVEQVSAMPGQGVVSMFSFGHSAGVIEGVLASMGVPYELVTPQKWKGYYGLKGKRKKKTKGKGKGQVQNKDASRAKAIQLYPGAPLGRKKDVGRADAILIARYKIDSQRHNRMARTK